MILHLNLTDDHLKLVRFLNVEDKDDDFIKINKKVMLTIQSHILDDIAMVLGLRDKAIPNTQEDADAEAQKNYDAWLNTKAGQRASEKKKSK